MALEDREELGVERVSTGCYNTLINLLRLFLVAGVATNLQSSVSSMTCVEDIQAVLN